MKPAYILSPLLLILCTPLLAQGVDWDSYLKGRNYPVEFEYKREPGHLLSSLSGFRHPSLGVVISARSREHKSDPFLVQFTERGKTIYTFVANEYTSFMLHGDVLYYSAFSRIDCGAKLVAFDLKSKKKLWTADVGLSVSHSIYGNFGFVIEQYQDKAVLVFGKEMAGKYIYAVDTATGKVLAKRTDLNSSNP